MRPEGPGEVAKMKQHLPAAKSAQPQPSLADVCPTCSQKPSAATAPHPLLAFPPSPPFPPPYPPVTQASSAGFIRASFADCSWLWRIIHCLCKAGEKTSLDSIFSSPLKFTSPFGSKMPLALHEGSPGLFQKRLENPWERC